MQTVIQYPHYLFKEVAEPATQDEKGNWEESEVRLEFLSMCRHEVNSSASRYQVAGGNYEVVSALIQCPTTCPVVEKGAKVIVANDGNGEDVRVSGLVMECNPAQLHTRIWI